MLAEDVTKLLELINTAQQRFQEERREHADDGWSRDLLPPPPLPLPKEKPPKMQVIGVANPENEERASLLAQQEKSSKMHAIGTEHEERASLIAQQDKSPKMQFIGVANPECEERAGLINDDTPVITPTFQSESTGHETSILPEVFNCSSLIPEVFRRSSLYTKKPWYVGEWVDTTGSFFNGSIIEVRIDGWEPQVRKTGQYMFAKGTAYALQAQQERISLFEARADGEQRTFKAVSGPKNTMIVRLEGGSGQLTWDKKVTKKTLTWTLVRYVDPGDAQESLALQEFKERRKDLFKQSTVMDVFRERKKASPASQTATFFRLAIDVVSSVRQSKSFRIRLANAYESKVGLIVMCSLICLGLELDLSLPDRSVSGDSIPSLEVVESVCVALFMLDIFLHLYMTSEDTWASLRSWWFHPWWIAVVVSFFYQWIIKPFKIEGAFAVSLRSLRLLRVVRILKETRAVKSALGSVPMISARWSMVCSVLLVALLINYVFACLALEFVTKSETLAEALRSMNISHRYHGLYNNIVEIMMFVNSAGWSSWSPLVVADPWLICLFLPLVLVLPLGLMNLVSGVILESTTTAIAEAKKSEEDLLNFLEVDIVKETPLYEEFFQDCVKMHEQVLEKRRFERLDFRKLPQEIRSCITSFHIDSMGDFFDILDSSVSGTLTEHQFVTSMLNLRIAQLSKVPCEILHALAILRVSEKRSKAMQTLINDVHAHLIQLSSVNPSRMQSDASIKDVPLSTMDQVTPSRKQSNASTQYVPLGTMDLVTPSRVQSDASVQTVPLGTVDQVPPARMQSASSIQNVALKDVKPPEMPRSTSENLTFFKKEL